MKKILYIILVAHFILHLPTLLFGQDQNIEQKSKNNASIEAITSLNFYKYRFINEDGTGLNNFTYNNKINYLVGVNLNLKVDNSFDVGLGLQWSRKSFQKLYDIDSFEAEQMSIKVDYFPTYIDVPISIKGRITKGEGIYLVIGSAIVPGILVNSKTITSSNDKSINNSSVDNLNFKSIAIGSWLSAGVKYKINDHFSFGTEPYLRYDFIKISSVISRKPVSVGSYLILSYKF